MDATPRLATFPEESSSFADTLHNLLRFGRALRARKIYLLASVAICGMLGALYYGTATRIYEATAVVMVMKTGSDYWDPSSLNSQGMDQLPTYERLFSSDVVLKGACQRIKAKAATIPSEWLVDFDSSSFDVWSDVIRDSLSTSTLRNTQLIELCYSSKNPDGATLVINAIVDSYLEYIEQNHKDNSARIFELLEGKRKEVEGQLAAKQMELLNISRQVKTIGAGTDTMVQPLVQRAVSLNEALIEVQKERLNLEATSKAISAALQHGGDLRQHLENLGEFPGRELIENALGMSTDHVQSVAMLEQRVFEENNQLRSYAQYLGSEHPKVIELGESIQNTSLYLNDIRQQSIRDLSPERRIELGRKLLSVASEKVAQASSYERELLNKFSEAETEAIQLNDQQAQLAFGNHELDRLRSLHDTLLDRMSTIEIKQDHADVSVAVTEDPEATPYPVSPGMTKVAAISLFFGCGIGLMMVYVLDLLEDRFRSPEELRDQTGAAVLAVVRDIPALEGQGLAGIQVHVAPSAVESEAFRTLRTSLTFAHHNQPLLAVTSPEPGDGKTTVITNLAVSLAQAGRKTLLIDADLRKPGLSRLFGVRGLGGLSEALRSDSSVIEMTQDRIRRTEIEGLDLMPCGPKPIDPSILLESPGLEDILAWAETEYDNVLIDCPPIMVASDASIVGRLTNGILVVVQPEKNHRRLVLRAFENLTSFQIPVVGIVANRVTPERESGYIGYGYGYGKGYGENDTDTFTSEIEELNNAA